MHRSVEVISHNSLRSKREVSHSNLRCMRDIAWSTQTGILVNKADIVGNQPRSQGASLSNGEPGNGDA